MKKIINCKHCNKETTNKVYCSEYCQHKGSSTRKKIPCGACGNLTKNPKFCSRKCYSVIDSKNKIAYYKKHGHHSTGTKYTEERKEIQRLSAIRMWQNDEVRNKIKESCKATAKNNGYPNGHSLESKIKRNRTIEKNGGHNFAGKYGTRPCDLTFIAKYGMTSAEFRTLKIREHSTQTSIELKIESILNENNIEYIYQHKLGDRHFDFYLTKFNILIECDGNYWHGKDIEFPEMNAQQQQTYLNDQYKNKLVDIFKIPLIRFWESEILELGFDEKLLTTIYEYK